MSEAKWYVVHTYSGYENKVKVDIEKTIENRHLEDQILEVRGDIPEESQDANGQTPSEGINTPAPSETGSEENVSWLCTSQHGYE